MFSENYHIKKKQLILISFLGVRVGYKWLPDKVWMPKTWKTPQLFVANSTEMDGWKEIEIELWSQNLLLKGYIYVYIFWLKRKLLIIPNGASLLSEYSNPFFGFDTAHLGKSFFG